MQNVSLTAFSNSMALLRQALADADPLAASAQDGPITATASEVAAAFDAAPERERTRFLLRALDDAIAAIEISALLAEQFNSAQPELHPTAPYDSAAEQSASQENALLTAYLAFAESQPAYQALYHYRNALAARLRLDARLIPPTVQPPLTAAPPERESASPADTQAPPAPDALSSSHRAPRKPRKRE